MSDNEENPLVELHLCTQALSYLIADYIDVVGADEAKALLLTHPNDYLRKYVEQLIEEYESLK